MSSHRVNQFKFLAISAIALLLGGFIFIMATLWQRVEYLSSAPSHSSMAYPKAAAIAVKE